MAHGLRAEARFRWPRWFSEAQVIDNNLAPEREIAVSQEHHVAQKAIQIERRKAKKAQSNTSWEAFSR